LAVRRRRLCLADALPHSPIHRGIGGSLTPSTEKNHACEEKRREKGRSEVDAQVRAEEGRSSQEGYAEALAPEDVGTW
jgi:hypothetical protein